MAFTDTRLFLANNNTVKSFDKITMALQNTYTLPGSVSWLLSDGFYIWAGQPSAIAKIDTVFP